MIKKENHFTNKLATKILNVMKTFAGTLIVLRVSIMLSLM